MLSLPDVAQLVRDEVVRRPLAGAPAEQNCPEERIAAVAPEARQAEEERRGDDADALDADRARVELEPVEARLRARERRGRFGLYRRSNSGASTRIALPSWSGWNSYVNSCCPVSCSINRVSSASICARRGGVTPVSVSLSGRFSASS